jgi:hypothetical protein
MALVFDQALFDVRKIFERQRNCSLVGALSILQNTIFNERRMTIP